MAGRDRDAGSKGTVMANDKPRYARFKPDKPVVIGLVHPESMTTIEHMKAFGDEVVAVAKKHARLPLILNFEQVEFLSSAALSELIRIRDAVESNGGALRLCGVSKEMYKVFDVTKLADDFHLRERESPAEAIARFKQDVASRNGKG